MSDVKYVGSSRTGVVHAPWCEWASRITDESIIYFGSLTSAGLADFRMCKICLEFNGYDRIRMERGS